MQDKKRIAILKEYKEDLVAYMIEADRKRNKKVNHLLHLVLSVLTCGVWLLVWITLIGTANTGWWEKEFIKTTLELEEVNDELYDLRMAS